jgi:2-oxoglutarate dehydrogenase E2 component (dihydrolipoamide succinyltransferase)
MIIEIKVPSPGESITEVELTRWLIGNGDYVEKDQELAEVESDKATLPLLAGQSGKITLLAEPGLIKVGTIACTIDTSVEAGNKKASETMDMELSKKIQTTKSVQTDNKSKESADGAVKIKVTPLAQKLMDESGTDLDAILNGLKKITTREVNLVLQSTGGKMTTGDQQSRELKKEKMSQLRRKISERLVAVKNQTAMLTTFNEIDMSALLELKQKHQKAFLEKYGIKLGLMSYFAKAASIALLEHKKINSYIEADEIISPQFVDISIAVQTDKGLMVPVIRNVESLTIPQIEAEIAALAAKARAFRLTPEEMSGGTFTITNGGVFGSLFSTPILNPPQSGILGMHNIVERPVAQNGQVVIRPMMYIALSYDHRMIDGKDSVSFLMRVKELVESPVKMLIEIPNPDKTLLGL